MAARCSRPPVHARHFLPTVLCYCWWPPIVSRSIWWPPADHHLLQSPWKLEEEEKRKGSKK
jgi:hypothetical protein